MESNALVLKVESREVTKATGALGRFTKQAHHAERATDKLGRETGQTERATRKLSGAQRGATVATKAQTAATSRLGGAMKGLLGPLLAVAGPIIAIRKLLGSTVELQDFQAQLKVATGTVENAGEAFDALEDFASTTPYALEQSLDAFIKLTNLGLTPSEEALTSYGNTASAMGKDLTQLIEAVADATTGEFERLKEFGIKASSEGDRVRLTFRGVTKEIGKNAAEIEQYLIAIGQNEFAGAMEERMATVGGQLSNLGDLWNQLFRTISEQGAGEAIGASLQVGIDALEEIIAQLESGQFQANIESWTVSLDRWAEDFEEVMDFVSTLLGNETDEMSDDMEGTWDGFIFTLKNLPNTVRYYLKVLSIELGALILYGEVAAEGMKTAIIAKFEELVAAAKNYGKAIGSALNPFDDADFREAIEKGIRDQAGVMAETREKIAKAGEEALERGLELRKIELELLGAAQEEFDRDVQRVRNLQDESEILREKYEEEKAAKEAARAGEDRLARFKIVPEGAQEGATGATGVAGGPKGRAKASGGRSGPSEFDKLVAQLRDEEQVIEESYLKRLELVRRNTAAGSALRDELTEKLTAQYEEELVEFGQSRVDRFDILQDSLAREVEAIQANYEERREVILQNEAITEEEKTALIVRLTEERNKIVRGLEVARAQQGLGIAEDYFSGFSQLADSNNKKLAKIGEAALIAQKAIAITQATIKTYEAATSAYASQAAIPVYGPALGTAAAAAAIASGLANVAAIASASTSVGSYTQGGIIPGSSFSGDRLTANVNSSEMILNRQQQAELFELANGRRSGGGDANVTIINQTSAPVEGEARTNESGEIEIIIREAVDRTKNELTAEANSGGGTVIPAIQKNFNLRRGVA